MIASKVAVLMRLDRGNVVRIASLGIADRNHAGRSAYQIFASNIANMPRSSCVSGRGGA